MSSSLPYGIRAQSGASTFKREVEQSLAPWRDMIARDDARVVRSIHCPQVPNAADGFSPIVLYQIALRDSGKIVQVSIQGKHDPLPNPVSSWSETRAQGRKKRKSTTSAPTTLRTPTIPPAARGNGGPGRDRTDSSEGKIAAAKRRMQMSNEEEETHEANEHQLAEYEDGAIRQRRRVALQVNGEASNDGYCEGGEHQQYDEYEGDEQPFDGYEYTQTDQSGGGEVVAHVSLHPPTPQKRPSKPSSRQPRPPRYSARRSTSLAGQGLVSLYGLNDLREPDDSIRYFPSTAANSETGESCSGETMDSHATYTQSNHQQRGLRRSSRLASLPPGSFDEEVRHHEGQVQATTHRLAEVELLPRPEEGQENANDHNSNLDPEDVDMSSMILEYEDEEETRLAREQIRSERQRRTMTEQEIDEEMMTLDRWFKPEDEAS